MGLLKVVDNIRVDSSDYFGVGLQVRFDAPAHSYWYGFQPDVQVFPLYCSHCHNSQKHLFLHLGSRYGQVGSTKCEYCGEKIYVTDHDNIVDSILINGEEIYFYELYKLKYQYVEFVESEFNLSFKEMFNKINWIKLSTLQEQLENVTGINTTGLIKYVTDKRFLILPPEVNRWIEFLELCGEKLFIEKV